MVRVSIVIRTTHFVVNIHDQHLNHVIKTVCSNLVTYNFVYDKYKRKMLKQKDKSFYTHVQHTNEYRFSIEILRDFMLTLGSNQVKREEIKVTQDRNYDISSLNLRFNKTKYKLRDYQKKYSKLLISQNSSNIQLVDLRTGYGKTLISMDAIVKLNYRLGILILPKYIDKWISDVKDITDVEDEDIFVVQGGDSLVELMEEEDHTYKIIIFSMRTIANYIKQYEDTVFTYPVKPGDLMQHLGIGTLLNDETHQEHHALFKASLYFEVRKLIGLSATLVSNQKETDNMYRVLFPDKKRLSNLIEYEKFINVKAINYKLEHTRGIHYQRQQGYNHNLYEQSIMRNNILLRDYIEMILYYTAESYISRCKKGEKLLIFMASVRMCTIVRNYIANKYEDLDVRRYVEDDPYENLMEADICVTTVLSAGTAVDIPGLISVIQTISISSLQANLQAVGRLRKLKDTEVWYYYVYTRDIGKQYKMHKDRRQAIQHTVKEYQNAEYHKTLKVK